MHTNLELIGQLPEHRYRDFRGLKNIFYMQHFSASVIVIVNWLLILNSNLIVTCNLNGHF